MAAAKGSSSSAVRLMAAGWGLFTGTHLVMSHPPVREALVKTLGGEKQYLGAYSAVAAATFFPTTFVYLRYGRGKGIIPGYTNLTQTNFAVRGLGLATKVAAGVTFGQAIGTPSKVEEVAMKKQAATEVPEAVGIYRVTRHPTFTALALLGLGNILLRGFAGDVVYWGGWVAIWAMGCPHQDYRLKVTGLVPQGYYDKTSFLPFQAIAEGRNSLSEAFKEFNKPLLVTAIAVPIFFL